jgi:hypothetical protein
MGAVPVKESVTLTGFTAIRPRWLAIATVVVHGEYPAEVE